MSTTSKASKDSGAWHLVKEGKGYFVHLNDKRLEVSDGVPYAKLEKVGRAKRDGDHVKVRFGGIDVIA